MFGFTAGSGKSPLLDGAWYGFEGSRLEGSCSEGYARFAKCTWLTRKSPIWISLLVPAIHGWSEVTAPLVATGVGCSVSVGAIVAVGLDCTVEVSPQPEMSAASSNRIPAEKTRRTRSLPFLLLGAWPTCAHSIRCGQGEQMFFTAMDIQSASRRARGH